MAIKRVLIVHPDPYACGRLASRLYRTGFFAVDSAQDGFEAAAKLHGQEFHCLILHTLTPGAHPVRAVNQVRGVGSMSRMPIVVLCADADPSTLETLRSLDETYLLVEPFDPNELAETTIRLTGVKREHKVERRVAGRRRPRAPEPKKPAEEPKPIIDRPRIESAPQSPNILLDPAVRPTGGKRAAAPESPPPKTPDPVTPHASDPSAPYPTQEAPPAHVRHEAEAFLESPKSVPDDPAPEAPPEEPRSAATPPVEDDLGPARTPRGRAHASTNVGMGLTDAIWYRAEKGAQIPGLPPGASKLDDLVSGRLGDVLSKDLLAIDQNLAVAILRQANSIEFGGMDKVAGLDQAMLRVGQRGVARHVITTWESRSKIAAPTRDFLLHYYWRHCLMVACIAEEIAAHLRYRNTGAVFSAGLLHDVGKLFFVTYFREDYERVTQAASDLGNPFDGDLDISAFERDVLKVDHGLIGFELCHAWGMPPIIQAGTLHHHLNSDRTRRLPDSLVTMIVALANLVEHTLRRVQEQKYREGYDRDPTVSDLDADMEMVAQEVLQAFYKSIYTTVPFWVHQFLRGKQVPLRHVYEIALRRVKRATRRAGLAAYSPRWAGGTLEDRKAG